MLFFCFSTRRNERPASNGLTTDPDWSRGYLRTLFHDVQKDLCRPGTHSTIGQLSGGQGGEQRLRNDLVIIIPNYGNIFRHREPTPPQHPVYRHCQAVIAATDCRRWHVIGKELLERIPNQLVLAGRSEQVRRTNQIGIIGDAGF